MENSLSEVDFIQLRSIIHSETGITISDNRKRMLYSRLQSRLRATGSVNFREYIEKIRDDDKEMQEFKNRVTTNETYFYRTPRIWSHFRTETIPNFLELQPQRPMNVWSAAASTGEEAHTVGVVLESVRQTHTKFDYSVLGTDISTRVIGIAKQGHYKGRPLARFRNEEPELFLKFMTGTDSEGYYVTQGIRQRISFRTHNLTERLSSGGPFDVVFLRNVLIYFVPEDQERILANIYEQMRPNGTLFIGESETLSNLKCKFEQISPLVYKPCFPGVRS